MGVYEITFMI